MPRNFYTEDEHWRLHYTKDICFVDNQDISRLIGNDPSLRHFTLEPEDSEHITGVGWEMLGRCISDNDHLETVSLSSARDHLIDSDVSMLFQGLKNGGQMKEFTFSCNGFGLTEIRKMVPFLCFSRNLINLTLIGSHRMNAQCFALLVDALYDGPIESLALSSCNLEDISSLVETYSVPHVMAFEHIVAESRCNLPNLRSLDLDGNCVQNISSLVYYTQLEELYLEGNDIGKCGFTVISKLLQNEHSSLRVLSLNSTGMGDDDAELIANSLQNNATLTDLSLIGNQFRENGCKAFFILLLNMSSIDSTYHSNHTLTSLSLPYYSDPDIREIKSHIEFARRINDCSSSLGAKSSNASGRAKVLAAQLKLSKRILLSRIQGIEYSYSYIFSEIDPAFLPQVFALAGEEHGHNEMYCMLVSMPELVANAKKDSALTLKTPERSEPATSINKGTVNQKTLPSDGHLQPRRQIFPHAKMTRLKNVLRSRFPKH